MTDIMPRQDWTEADAYIPQPLWLSRLTMTGSGKRLDERDIHLTLEWAHLKTGHGRILWAQPTRDLLIVQSPGPLDMTRLVGIVAGHAERTRISTFHACQRVRVSGILNPAFSGARRRHGRPAVPPDRYSEWLTARLGGVVEVDEVRVEPLQSLRVSKPGHLVTAARAGFEATGIVVHPGRLAWLCDHGLGDQRAYGCGLLLAVCS